MVKSVFLSADRSAARLLPLAVLIPIKNDNALLYS